MKTLSFVGSRGVVVVDDPILQFKSTEPFDCGDELDVGGEIEPGTVWSFLSSSCFLLFDFLMLMRSVVVDTM